MVFRDRVRGAGKQTLPSGECACRWSQTVTAELACRSRRCVARSQASRVPVGAAGAANPAGPAVVAEIQSDQMDFTLVPLPPVIEPRRSVCDYVSLAVTSTVDNAPKIRKSVTLLTAHYSFCQPAIAVATYPYNEARSPMVHHLT
jgi:hypothetical protein